MTIETIEKIPFLERKHFVQDTCLMYKKMIRAKEKLLLMKEDQKLDSDRFKSISLFEEIVNLLNSDEAMVLKNDFIDTEYKGE